MEAYVDFFFLNPLKDRFKALLSPGREALEGQKQPQ